MQQNWLLCYLEYFQIDQNIKKVANLVSFEAISTCIVVTFFSRFYSHYFYSSFSYCDCFSVAINQWVIII